MEAKPRPNTVLRDFWLTPARNRVLYGGRSSSKSWDAAAFAVYLASKCKIRFLCARQFQNKIAESVYTLLKIQIERFGKSSEFKILDNSITHLKTGSEFLFYGLWRSIDEIKSLEGVDICWIEEAHNLTKEQWEILEPTIRKEGSQFWIIFNPRLSTDFVYKRFVTSPPPDTIVRKINYNENPFLSSTIIKVIEAAKAADHDEYMHIYEGVPNDDDDDSVIKRSWLLAAIDAHKKLGIEPTGSRRLGFDVADAGEDSCATIEAFGSLAVSSDLWKAKEDELLKSCTRVWHSARELEALVIYDAIGVGAGVGAKFNELNVDAGIPVHHQKFFAGGAVMKPDDEYAHSGIKNKDFFANIKAQVWWAVADRLKNTYNAVQNGQEFSDDELIFIDSSMPNIDKLIDELSTPKRDFDTAGRVKVESKSDLKKREIASPNLADAFIMAYLPISGAALWAKLGS
ncbi:MAG: PBSX family phage terminase large subunit [Sulfuricella sp.]